MSEDHDTLHFKSSSRCSLCRKRLPQPQHDFEYGPPENEAWEYKVLGFCDISHKKPGIVAIPADLMRPGTLSELVVTIRSGRCVTIQFCLESECQRCAVGNVAYLVHLYCWKLVRENYSARTIYEFAQSTYPVFEDEGTLGSESTTTIDFANISARTSIEWELGRLLRSISRLPNELQLAILAGCPQCSVLSLLTVIETSCMLLSNINRYPDQNVTKLDNIEVAFITVFGQRYISSVRVNRDNGNPVKRSQMKGIKFVVGPYGLRAIGILYADESTSTWIGNSSKGWMGVMYGSDIRSLRVLQDNLKCLRIDLAKEETRSATRSRVMWDKELHFTSAQSHHILETVRALRHVRNYPRWRLCKYLSFLEGGIYISGLTMYCNGHSITGMIAHGQSRRLIGRCEGCPIHLYLQPKERILSVWLRIPAAHVPVENEPNILVVTSNGRACIFGPCLPPSVIRECGYAWTPLTKDSQSDVLGIFYNSLSMRRRHRITSVGITQGIKPKGSFATKLPVVPIARFRPRMSGDEITGLFFSIGSFKCVRRLMVRRVGPRLTGMSIHHDDGTIDVLGQWDCSQSSSISEIYNHATGTLTSVTFRFLRRQSASYVDGIFVGVNHEKPLNTGQSRLFSIEDMSQPTIVWWFSLLYDMVEPWDGVYQEINVSTCNYNIVDLE